MFAEAFNILVTYREGFWQGLQVTLQLCAIIWTVGIVFGTLLGIAASQSKLQVGLPVRLIAFILGGVPTLVFLFWLHYPAQAMFQVVINPFITAAVTFSVLNIFGVAEIVRVNIDELPTQYVAAGKVCGMSQAAIVRHIQLPILLRHIIPGLLMLQVTMLHTTLFASLISVEEIFRVAQRINASIYKPVEIYTALGFFFLMVSLPVNGVALWLKSKYTRNTSEN